jgi:hypothetical protein
MSGRGKLTGGFKRGDTIGVFLDSIEGESVVEVVVFMVVLVVAVAMAVTVADC